MNVVDVVIDQNVVIPVSSSSNDPSSAILPVNEQPPSDLTEGFLDAFEDAAIEAHNVFINAWKDDSAMEIVKNRRNVKKMLAERVDLRAAHLRLKPHRVEDRLAAMKALSAISVEDVYRRPVYFNIRIYLKKHAAIRHSSQPVTLLPMIEVMPESTFFSSLETNYRADDAPVLQYVPYFGDEDHEDVVSNLFEVPDVVQSKAEAEWEMQLMDHLLSQLPTYEDKVLRHVQIQALLAKNFYLQPPCVRERVDEFIKSRRGTITTTISEEINSILKKEKMKSASEDTPTDSDENSIIDLAGDDDDDESEEAPMMALTLEKQAYVDFMDTCRLLFCRRCFVYDCNRHGTGDCPQLHVQTRKAIHFRDLEYQENVIRAPVNEKPCGTRCWKQANITGHSTSNDMDALRVIVRKSFEICAGNYCLMTGIVGHGFTCEQLALYCLDLGLTPESIRLEIEDHLAKKGKKNKKKSSGQALCIAKRAKATENNELMHTINPCNHEGPCTTKCSCVQSKNFCTKFCFCIADNCRNFHHGCKCGSRCKTKTCPCLAADRECDPDLCMKCSPEIPPSEGGCFNLDLSRGKHKRLLLGKSLIEGAGWGLFTRDFVLKDEFIHEYKGELLSQDEAERRGIIQDKKNRSYLFDLDEESVVDALRKGNKTRFANHSDRPNCMTKNKCVNGEYTIGFYAIHNIPAHSELLFNYFYKTEDSEGTASAPKKKGLVIDWMKNPDMAGQVRIQKRGEK